MVVIPRSGVQCEAVDQQNRVTLSCFLMVELRIIYFSVTRLHRTHDTRMIEEGLTVWRKEGIFAGILVGIVYYVATIGGNQRNQRL